MVQGWMLVEGLHFGKCEIAHFKLKVMAQISTGFLSLGLCNQTTQRQS